MIVIHAGMLKTGSSAIPTWLGGHKDLLAEHDFTLVVGRPDPGPDLIRVQEHSSGTANSGGIVHRFRDEDTKKRAAERFAEQLESLAEVHGPIVLSGGTLGELFYQLDLEILGPLAEVAGHKTVRVAYYAHPQHQAIEAAWRQWGFRSGMSSAKYAAHQAQHLHYFDMVSRATVDVPAIDLAVRPFAPELLAGGNVVEDFAHQFLGISDANISEPTNTDVELPLVVVNLLATVPGGLLWDSVHDDRALDRLRGLLAGIPNDDPRAEKGRQVLQAWCADHFGHGNQALLDLMGWPLTAEEWIPPTNEAPSLDGLDVYWAPSASAAELSILHRLLDQIVNYVR